MSGLTGNNILGGSSGQSTGYDIDQSLRFDGSGYLSRSISSDVAITQATISFWIKRAAIDTTRLQIFDFGAESGDSNEFDVLRIKESGTGEDSLVLFNHDDGSDAFSFETSQVFRDPSAWYNICIAYDTGNATEAQRLKLFVNGEQVTSFTSITYPTQNDPLFLSSRAQTIGANYAGSYDGNYYLAEFYYIEGSSLTPESFGETNSDTNQWIAKKYAGSYGTNGFYLKFQDSSALGDDSSGNTNDFTVTNLAATDQVIDTPTNNYCTINPLVKDYTTSWTLSEGNLKFSATSDSFKRSSFMLPSSGKWYCEVRIDNNAIPYMGVASLDPLLGTYNIVKGTFFYNNSGLNSSYVGYDGGNLTGHSNASNGDIVGIAHDSSTGETKYYLNNSLLRTVTTAYTSDDFTFYFAHGSSGGSSGMTVNFGQDSSFAGQTTAQGNGGVGEDFYYTPPTGYQALNTDNIDDPSIALPTDHFNTKLYVGNGSTQSITGVGFQPDFTWLKHRNSGALYGHQLFDSVRTATKYLVSNTNATEVTDATTLTSFDSDGFSLGTNVGINQNTINHVGWNWKAGGTAVSNTDGTITSSVSANPTAGFSIVSYTGNATTGATVGHGLSQAPEMLIVKQRDAVKNWSVLANSDPTDYIMLNSSNATADDSRFWNDTNPSASVFTLGSLDWVNANTNTYIAYCFHSVEGYSKVGSYTGNGSTDGPFVYTGFRPAFLLIKRINATGVWPIFDNKRVGYNWDNRQLRANETSAEETYNAFIDILSNGFKCKNAAADKNADGSTYIYLAFAESPFKYSNAR